MKTINRDASDKTQGFRLQKLRAIKLVLESTENDEIINVYSAIEVDSDVYHRTVTTEDNTTFLEEDKSYDKETGFSLNSHAILNTLVIFLDVWISKSFSSKIRFAMYSTNNIAKESSTSKINGLKIDLPDEPIIQLLINKDYKENLIDTISKLIINEYENQYKEKGIDGHLELIKKLEPKEWEIFIKSISWSFESDNLETLEDNVTEQIMKNKYFAQLENFQAENIKSALLNLLEKKQLINDEVERFMSGAEVKNIFLEIRKDYVVNQTDDYSWELWEKIEKNNTDYRNLGDKIKAVCKDYSKKRFEYLSTVTTRAKVLGNINGESKEFLSLKYRIYENCKGIVSNYKGDPINEVDLDKLINELNEKIYDKVTSLKKDYRYSISDEELDGIILDLFDNCFLSFDEGGQNE